MPRLYVATAVAALLGSNAVFATIVARQTSSSDGAAADLVPTAVSQCSLSSSTQICSVGTTEYRIVSTPTGSLPSSYTSCHQHASETYCFYSGGEVQILPANAAAVTMPAATTTAHDHAAETGSPTAVSECHQHGSEVFCMWGPTEYQVMTTATATAIPSIYTDCHSHGSEIFCVGPDGGDVEIRAEGASGDHADSAGDANGSSENCHFHAGVEHCTGAAESTCERVTRDYNIPLRVGLLFVILVTSAVGVYAPILLIRYWPARTSTAFLVLKQFGTGVIVSTALIHLYTHAQLMFANECLGGLEYEGATSAIVMAGIFLSFVVEYAGKRVVLARMARSPGRVSILSPETVTVLVLEAGVIFHSICRSPWHTVIGITLVVAGDSFFLTLFVVILFHQMFEGIALGSRIAVLGRAAPGQEVNGAAPILSARQGDAGTDGSIAASEGSKRPKQPLTPHQGSTESLKAPYFSLPKKLLLASPFALVTPLGMAIGIGALQQFNGNNRGTILAIGTLDAVSAGILIWVGLVEMWAEDWMVEGAELLHAGPLTTLLAGLGLVGGMIIMSLLGKWA